ncbi:heparin lyase I [gut metagenome]|uniref:Heparin lyase I n=1 Tax=gut metagenome TaxID=749906 RepID=J9GGI7_9ZZZZ
MAVGTDAAHTLQRDAACLYQGEPSFRFELKEKDNSLSGYNEGETKGRVEMSYCYATPQDFSAEPGHAYERAQRLRTVYHYGKGHCRQGESMRYEFAIRIPDTLRSDVNAIFAQWHGMPRRNVAQNPEGKVLELTDDEFLKLEETTLFDKEVGYEKIPSVDKDGKACFKKGKPNGWLIEQGGYPPLAFGFNHGFFYVKANSDSKWFSDKSDRTNANVERLQNMESVSSDFKTSTLIYKESLDRFPRNVWVRFVVCVQWSLYDRSAEKVIQPGRLDITMCVNDQSRKLADDVQLPIGRNDRDGYYFKYGIYRTSSSTVPVAYHLAGYREQNWNR